MNVTAAILVLDYDMNPNQTSCHNVCRGLQSTIKYPVVRFADVPTAYVFLNSDMGSDDSIITEIKSILEREGMSKYEVQGVYGVYDIVLKLITDDAAALRSVITNKIRKITKVQSTLTMMVIEEQERPTVF